MPACILSKSAYQDLEEIWEYIAAENPKAANGVIEKIKAAFSKLTEMPGIGHKRADLTHYPVLFFAVYHYLIVYQSQSTGIEVVRVLSGYRDIADLLEI